MLNPFHGTIEFAGAHCMRPVDTTIAGDNKWKPKYLFLPWAAV